MRLIDADALIEDVDGDLTDSIAEGRAIEKIMNAPTIEDRKTGKWIETDSHEPCWFKCDQCGRLSDIKEIYCPTCGASMVNTTCGANMRGVE